MGPPPTSSRGFAPGCSPSHTPKGVFFSSANPKYRGFCWISGFSDYYGMGDERAAEPRGAGRSSTDQGRGMSSEMELKKSEGMGPRWSSKGSKDGDNGFALAAGDLADDGDGG